MADPRCQAAHGIRFDWGPEGARRIAGDVLVVVDVLSFSTSVDILVNRGTEVFPSPWHGEQAKALANRHIAELAVPRRKVDPSHPWSLSPAALVDAPPTRRLVLPSPNGSTIASAVECEVVTACLRNASAVGKWLAQAGYGSVAVVAAGERWADGSLRPAVEDLIGAAAVINALTKESDLEPSPEAKVATASLNGTFDVEGAVRGSASALELIDGDQGADVDLAVLVDVSTCVPLARPGGGFVDALRRT